MELNYEYEKHYFDHFNEVHPEWIEYVRKVAVLRLIGRFVRHCSRIHCIGKKVEHIGCDTFFTVSSNDDTDDETEEEEVEEYGVPRVFLLDEEISLIIYIFCIEKTSIYWWLDEWFYNQFRLSFIRGNTYYDDNEDDHYYEELHVRPICKYTTHIEFVKYGDETIHPGKLLYAQLHIGYYPLKSDDRQLQKHR